MRQALLPMDALSPNAWVPQICKCLECGYSSSLEEGHIRESRESKTWGASDRDSTRCKSGSGLSGTQSVEQALPLMILLWMPARPTPHMDVRLIPSLAILVSRVITALLTIVPRHMIRDSCTCFDPTQAGAQLSPESTI